MSDVRSLSRGWLKVELSEIVDIYDHERKPINASERNERIAGKNKTDLFPYYGATGQVGWIDEYLSDQGSVLLGEDGAPFLDPSKDKAYLVRGQFWVNNHAHILRGSQNIIENRFICYQLNTLEYRDFVSGSTRLKLTKSSLEKLPFLICPYKEQIRIVEKLEELLSDLDDGISELKTAQIKLGQYRQSLLKSAVDGSLTTEWRKQNSNKISETGEQLLTRILKERRQHWEKKKLAEFAAKDKAPPKNWQAKYPEPVAPDATELPELPEGWVWASLSSLVELIQIGPFGSLLHKHDYVTGGTPLVNPTHIKNLKIIPNHKLTVGESKLTELQNFVMKEGDIVIGRRGEMGRCAVITSIENGWLCGTGSIFIRLLPEMDPYFYSWVLSSKRVKDFLSDSSVGTTMQNLNQKILHSVPVPLCTSNEQFSISETLKHEYEQINKKSKAIKNGIRNSEAQRKNILKDAFTGKLVPQDPNDEPASVLLEKIKAERAEQAKQPKPKRTKRKSKAMKKMDSNTLKLWVNELKQETFTFTELQKAFSGDYEELKEALFALLAEPNAVIEQIFDSKTGVLFQRING